MALPPTPAVSVFDNTVSVDEVVQALKLAGGCVIRNLLSVDTCAQIEKEIRPFLKPVPSKDEPVDLKPPGERQIDKNGNVSVFDDVFFPKQSRRAFSMMEKSYTSAREVVMNPLYVQVVRAFLTSYIDQWVGKDLHHDIAEPQVNNSICFSIMPGSTDQPLHRDDPPQHMIHSKIDTYPEDLTKTHRDACIGLFVAGKKATKQNGATRFIPGSHLWGMETPPDESLAYYAELEIGDAFIMLGSCYHGGSANKTEDEERLLFSTFWLRGFQRPEENMWLAIPPSKVAKWPVDLQRAIGYYIAFPSTGYVEQEDPRNVLVEQYGAEPIKA